MTGLTEALIDYGWWIVGLVLLVLEVVVPGVYLIFFAVAALIVGTNVLIVGDWFGWQQQVVAFVVLSIVCILVGRNFYGVRSKADPHDRLNRRTAGLVGREAVLTEAIVNGRGRIAIDDGWWSVSGGDLPQGERVRVVGADGSVLAVVPAGSPAPMPTSAGTL